MINFENVSACNYKIYKLIIWRENLVMKLIKTLVKKLMVSVFVSVFLCGTILPVSAFEPNELNEPYELPCKVIALGDSEYVRGCCEVGTNWFVANQGNRIITNGEEFVPVIMLNVNSNYDKCRQIDNYVDFVKDQYVDYQRGNIRNGIFVLFCGESNETESLMDHCREKGYFCGTLPDDRTPKEIVNIVNELIGKVETEKLNLANYSDEYQNRIIQSKIEKYLNGVYNSGYFLKEDSDAHLTEHPDAYL